MAVTAAHRPIRGLYPGTYPRLQRTPPRPAVKVKMPAVAGATPPASSLGAAAQAFIAAQLKPLADQIAQSTQAGQRAVTGYQTEAARVLGGLPVKLGDLANVFNSSFGNVARGTTDAIAGQGSKAAADLSAVLAARGQNTAPAGEIAANGIGAAGASAGLGSAAAGRLAGFGKSAVDLATKLPYIGYLRGLQDTQNLAYKGSQDTAALQEKAVSMLPTVLSSMQAAEDRRAAAKATADYRTTTAKATADYRKDSLALSTKRELYNEWLQQRKLGQTDSKQTFDEWYKTQQLGVSQQRAATAAGQLTLGERKRADALAAKVKTGGFTPAQISAKQAMAGAIAAAAWNGKPASGAGKVKTWNGHPVAQMKLADDGTPDPTNGTPHWVYTKPDGSLVALGAGDIPAIKSVAPTTHQTYQQAVRDMLAAGIPLEIAQKALNSYWTRPGQQAPWEKPGEGRPAQSYQERNPGKAGASADAGIARNTAYVTLAPGADRSGVPTQQAVLDFVGSLGRMYGAKLTIGTGSNHNEYVAGSHRESAHWTGRAADVPASGATLTKLGQDALILAGMPEAQARKQAGGLFNIGGYQIIFNSNIGGNHYNHLHVGVRGNVT